MKRFFSAAVAVSALVAATQANAADFVPGFIGPSPDGNGTGAFLVGGDPINGPVSAVFGRFSLEVGTFTDRFLFTIGADGLGSGDITTTFVSLSGLLDSLNPGNVDFLSVTFDNGSGPNPVTIITNGNQETGSGNNIPITAGVQNILSVTYLSRGSGQFSGTLSFLPTAPIPEPATWAMMLVGFGAIGFAMRRRKVQPKVRFAF